MVSGHDLERIVHPGGAPEPEVRRTRQLRRDSNPHYRLERASRDAAGTRPQVTQRATERPEFSGDFAHSRGSDRATL